MLRFSDEIEELEIPEEDDEDVAIGDDALGELTEEEEEDDEDDDDGGGFGHLDESEVSEKETPPKDEEEEEDEEDLPLEEDAEDVDYDSFDDIDEM